MLGTAENQTPLGEYDMTGTNSIPQGANWSVSFQYFDVNGVIIDLSTYTGDMQVRNGYGGPIEIELTTANGGITLSSGSGSTPNIVLNFSPALTSNVSVYDGMIYDIKLISSTGNVVKFIEGNFSLHRTVTP